MSENKTARNYSSNLIKSIAENRNVNKLKKIEKKMLLAARISDSIKEKGWSKKLFAEKMGRKPSQISNWLAGVHNFKLETLLEIETLLDIEIINPGEQKDIVQAYTIILNVNSKVEKSKSYSSSCCNDAIFQVNEPSVEYQA